MRRVGKARVKAPMLRGPEDSGFVLDEYPLYNLVRASATYTEAMAAALAPFGLEVTEWRILMLLDDRSPSAVGELARRSVTKLPTLTRLLMRMEAGGLITRRVSRADRRVVEIAMTAKAQKALRLVQSVGQRVFERAFEGIAVTEIEAATSALKRLRANLAVS